MIHSMVYTPQEGLERKIPLESVSDLISSEQNLVWLDVEDPTDKDFATLKEEFRFHELALEDAQKENQRAKVEAYNGHLFLVTYWVNKNDVGRLYARQLSIFIGKNYMVTIHRGTLPAIRESITRVEENPDLMRNGIGFLIYFVMDSIVDDYFPIMDELEDRLEVMEKAMFEGNGEFSVEDFFDFKRDFLTIRKVISPLRDAFNILTRQDQTIFSRESVVYFQDIYDHLLRIHDMIDTYRDILTGTMDAYLTITSNRLSSVMKTLTIVATIALPLTIIPSIYGMNFEYMPELHWRLGYPMSLAMMAAVGIGMWIWMRRKGWF